MDGKKYLKYNYRRCDWLIGAQAKGLTHEDSMLQLPFRGNCMNWVLGHILVHRERSLGLVGKSGGYLTDAEAKLYDNGSEPLTDGALAVPLEKLLADLNASYTLLTEMIVEMSAEQLGELVNKDKGITLEDQLTGLLWHETYHVGQLEYLRQLAGTDDQII